MGDLGSIPGLGRSLGEGKGYLLLWPGEFYGLYRLWGCKELDTTERLSLTSLTYFDVSPLQFCYEYLSNFIAHLSVYLKYL